MNLKEKLFHVVKNISFAVLIIFGIYTIYNIFSFLFLLDTNFPVNNNDEEVQKIIESNKNIYNEETEEISEYEQWILGEVDREVDKFEPPYSSIEPIIRYPDFKYPKNSNIYTKTYVLSTKDSIRLKCFKIDTKLEKIYDLADCDVFLNDKKVSKTWGWSDNVKSSAHLTIFDDVKIGNPILIISEYNAGGSRDDLAFYEIKDGKLEQYVYKYKDEVKKVWYSEPESYLYIDEKDKKKYFVTYFHDPAMPSGYIIRTWEVGNKELILKESVWLKYK